MTKMEAIRRACQLTALIYRSRGDYARPSDGFCDQCPAGRPATVQGAAWNFQHAGITFEYALEAIVERLMRDGYVVDAGLLAEIKATWEAK
jgi:hypothetical protein